MIKNVKILKSLMNMNYSSGGAPSCACPEPVFPVFFVRSSPETNQKMPKLTKTGYFWEILGSHTVKLVRKLTELV